MIQMPVIQKIFFYSISCIIFIIIFELVRKRKLKENYSWLWMLITVILFVLINQFYLLVKISAFLQVMPSIGLLFLGSVALLFLILQLFLINSKQFTQIKNISQKLALLEEKIRKNKK